jgi:hypothetical protein
MLQCSVLVQLLRKEFKALYLPGRIIHLSDPRQTSFSLRTTPLKSLSWDYTCTVTLKIIEDCECTEVLYRGIGANSVSDAETSNGSAK